MKGFWSYARADDDEDRLTHLKLAFEKTLKQTTGNAQAVIYMDKSHIRWGAEWARAIDEGIARSDFFIAVITPSYFERQHCRQELAKALHHGLKVYPLYYRTSKVFESTAQSVADSSERELVQSLSRIQYRDFRPLRNKPLQAEDVRVFLDALAEEVAENE